MPQISIGMPVYNGERYLREAIESILSQSFDDFELIISDNGSTDATPRLCRQFAARDYRVRLEFQPHNMGAAWNHNRVLALARGEFFKWASYDDLIALRHLECCLEAFEEHPQAVLCYPRTLLIDAEGANPVAYPDGLHLVAPNPVERFERFLFRRAKKCNPVLGLIRRSALLRSGGIGSYNSADQVLLANLALLGEFCEIPEPLLFRREHPASSLQANRTAREVASWFDPKSRHRIVLPALRLGLEYLRCIGRADLGPADRLRCSRLVAKRLWWDRHQVVREMKSVLNGGLPV